MDDAETGAPSRPISGNTVYRTRNAFEAIGGRVSSGVWESSAGKFRSDTTGYIEFGYILEGEARIVDPDGTVHHLAPGDPFIMPEGYKGHWEVDSRVKKVYFITRVD
ncbi:cupin domain-containing protein [Bordetella sp. 2513F-2]